MAGGLAGDKVGEKRKLYTHAEYYEMLDTDWPYDEDSTSEDPQMMAMVDQWLNKPQGNILNDSESDDESPLEHAGVFVDRGIRRDNLYFSEGLYDSEISQSPESSDSTTFEDNQSFTSTGSAEKQDKVSGNVPSSEMNPENVNNSQTSTRNRNSQNSASSEIEENEDINFHTSEGVGLERLREIISSQDRPRNSLGHIAALRRNFLRNDDEFS